MTSISRTYEPTADSEFGALMLAWASARYRESAARALDAESVAMLDEARSIVSSLLNTPAYASDARLATFGRQLEAAFLRKIEHEEPEAAADEYPPCPICGEPIDYCQGHTEAEEYDITEDADGVWLRERVTKELCGPYRTREEAIEDRADRFIDADDAARRAAEQIPDANELLKEADAEEQRRAASDGSDPYPDRDLPKSDRGDDYDIESKLALAHQALARFAETVRLAGNDASEIDVLMEDLSNIENKVMVLLHG